MNVRRKSSLRGIGGSQPASEYFAPEEWSYPHGFAYSSTTHLRMCEASSAPPKADLVDFSETELSLDYLLPRTNVTHSSQKIAWLCATILTPHSGYPNIHIANLSCTIEHDRCTHEACVEHKIRYMSSMDSLFCDA